MAEKNRFREELAEQFIKELEENPKTWHKGWSTSSTGRPYNVATGICYNGLNHFHLKLQEIRKEYKDPRWATFNQIKDNGWHLQKGAKGVQIEYWIPFDAEKGKSISWKEYESLSDEEKDSIFTDKDGIKREKYPIRPKYYTVFNASLIEGIPEYEIKPTHNLISPSKVVNMVADGMKINIYEDGGDRAFYRPIDDTIHLPKRDQFFDDFKYESTALHELGHATGSAERLNRLQSGGFGSEDYAYEELVAEITSSFMGEYVEKPITEENMNEHIAYVQSWASNIKDNKKYLFTAISDAEKAADYMVKKGGLEELKDVALIPYVKDWVRQLPDGQVWASNLMSNAEEYIRNNFQDKYLAKRVQGYLENNEIVKKQIAEGKRVDLSNFKKVFNKSLSKDSTVEKSKDSQKNKDKGAEI